MKKTIVTLILIVTLLFAVVPAQAFELYAIAGRIIDFDYEEDIVFFVDGAGLVWSFYGIEDWCIGDIVACVMTDNETPYVFDDEILSISYVGEI
jgi:hypothetical protein